MGESVKHAKKQNNTITFTGYITTEKKASESLTRFDSYQQQILNEFSHPNTGNNKKD